MLANFIFTQSRSNPSTSGFGIGHRLNRGESFGSDEKQRGFRLQVFECIRNMSAIHIGHKVHARAIVVRSKCQRCHGGSKVRPSNADIYHIGDFALAHIGGKARHGLQHVMHVMNNVVAVEHHNFRLGATQCGVQYGAAFSGIDHIPTHHGVAFALHVSGLRQGIQQLHRLLGDLALGIVQKQVTKRRRAFIEAVALRKRFAHIRQARLGVGLEFFENSARCWRHGVIPSVLHPWLC